MKRIQGVIDANASTSKLKMGLSLITFGVAALFGVTWGMYGIKDAFVLLGTFVGIVALACGMTFIMIYMSDSVYK